MNAAGHQTNKAVFAPGNAEQALVFPESAAARRWRIFRTWLARTGLAKDRPTGAVIDFAGESLVVLLCTMRRMVFPREHPWMTRLQFLMGWYEFDTVAVCKEIIRPGMTVLDIGAHTGYFTLLFSRLVGPTGRVYAFEPHEPTFRMLSHNLRSARYRNVTAVQKAVGDQPGEVEFFEMSAPGTHSLFNVAQHDPHFTLRRRLHTDCTTVDRFLGTQGNPQVDFIKMDIEGAEEKALAGMRKTVRCSENLAIVVELNVRSLVAAGTTPVRFLETLLELGFRPRAIAPDGEHLCLDERVLKAAERGPLNLLCTRSKCRPAFRANAVSDSDISAP